MTKHLLLSFCVRAGDCPRKNSWFAHAIKILDKYPTLAHGKLGELLQKEDYEGEFSDFLIRQQAAREKWNEDVQHSIHEAYVKEWKLEVNKRQSLAIYSLLKDEPSLEQYMRDINDTGRHLRLQLRSNTATLLSHMHTLDHSIPATCRCCNRGVDETRHHFILHCESYDDLREKWLNDLSRNLGTSPLLKYAMSIWLLELKIDPVKIGQSLRLQTDRGTQDKQLAFFLGSPAPPAVSALFDPKEDDDNDHRRELQCLQNSFSRFIEKSSRVMLDKMFRKRMPYIPAALSQQIFKITHKLLRVKDQV